MEGRLLIPLSDKIRLKQYVEGFKILVTQILNMQEEQLLKYLLDHEEEIRLGV